MADPLSILKIVVGPVADLFKRRSQRKQAKSALKAKAEMAKEGNAQELRLTDAEWEVLVAAKMDGTWKDEYALLVGTSFIPCLLSGAIWFAYSGDDRLIQGTVMGINALEAVGVDVGFLITAALLAGLGLSVWRKA